MIRTELDETLYDLGYRMFMVKVDHYKGLPEEQAEKAKMHATLAVMDERHLSAEAFESFRFGLEDAELLWVHEQYCN